MVGEGTTVWLQGHEADAAQHTPGVDQMCTVPAPGDSPAFGLTPGEELVSEAAAAAAAAGEREGPLDVRPWPSSAPGELPLRAC